MNAQPKPAKGAASDAQRRRRRLIETRERRAKGEAKARDRFTCRRCHRSTLNAGVVMEAAHIISKGMGGDHGLRSSERKDYVTMCARPCHRDIIHGERERMIFDPVTRGDGRVNFVPVTTTRPKTRLTSV